MGLDRRSRDRTPPPDEIEALRRSLVAGGALSRLPGPALLLDRTGEILASNRDAFPLRTWFQTGNWTDMKALAEKLAQGEGVVETVRFPGASEAEDRLFELTVAPVGSDGAMLVLGRDMTQTWKLREQLMESRLRFKDMVEISSDFAWETGADGALGFVSRSALGWRKEDLIGRRPLDLALPASRGDAEALFSTRVPIEQLEVWFRAADGSVACLAASATPLFGDDGMWRGARGLCRDVTAERARDQAFTRAIRRDALLTSILRSMRDEVEPKNMLAAAAAAMAPALQASGCVLYRLVDQAFKPSARFGMVLNSHAAAQIIGKLADDPEMIAADVTGRRMLAVGVRYRRQVNGAICLWRQPMEPPWSDEDRDLLNEVAVQMGVAIEQIANHEELWRVSCTDALTGLLNRRTFFAELPRLLAKADGGGRSMALAYVDLDNFKAVNDLRGHQAGDDALKKVAEILAGLAGPDDLTARLGGDEFALFLDGRDEAAAMAWGQECLRAVLQLKPWSGDPAKPLGFSIGLAVYQPGGGEQPQDLINRADHVMYEVKKAGKGSCRIAAPAGRSA